MESISKPWGGRFTEATDAFVEAFTASIGFDNRLYSYDIMGSMAHAQMLHQQNLLSKSEYQAIVAGLGAVFRQIETGSFTWDVALEDVHMNIEARLIDKIGDPGKKLHTGRSRNDQVATDIRLYLRDEIDNIRFELIRLQWALLDLADQEVTTIMPGFTHLQVAQPITFGHHMMAWFEMLKRDNDRLLDCRKRMNQLPLGAAALAGTGYSIDRNAVKNLLGFDALAANSLDAVSDRDFVIEFIAAGALIMMHLSRFSEELILWMSSQFSFIVLADRFCTGSSIMPQKKNPDIPELVRGKTGRINGNLVALLTLMKGQPLAYNKDNQEDKEPLFDTVDNVKGALRIFADMIPGIQVNREEMLESAHFGLPTATDLADYLVKKGIPFRQAHEIVGKVVHFCLSQQKDLADLALSDLQGFAKEIESDVFVLLTLEGSVSARDHAGGTAPKRVQAAIDSARRQLSGESCK